MENGCVFVLQTLPWEASPAGCRRPELCGDPFITRARTGGPPGRAPGPRGRAQEEGAKGQERYRAHVCKLMVHPSTLLFHVVEVFANQQLKFCPAQKSMIPKSVYGCFTERKHDTPS